MENFNVNEFIAKQNWTYAKTYAAFAPHEYVVRGKQNGTNEEYDAFGEYIQKNGIRMFYYRHERKYLFVDGWFYWILRSEENPADSVINRCKPEDYDVVFVKRGTQAKKYGLER